VHRFCGARVIIAAVKLHNNEMLNCITGIYIAYEEAVISVY